MANERYQTAYPAVLTGITSFPQAFQIDQREEAETLLYSPGIIVEGTTLSAQNLEVWFLRDTVASQGWIPTNLLSRILSRPPAFVVQAGVPAVIPWTGALKCVVLFQQFAGVAMVNSRIAFTVTPLSQLQRRM